MSHGLVDNPRLKNSINLSIARPENSIDSEGTNVSFCISEVFSRNRHFFSDEKVNRKAEMCFVSE